ncbi:hypothetical protein ACFL2B_01970 [Patescibacteria group bacterium]
MTCGKIINFVKKSFLAVLLLVCLLVSATSLAATTGISPPVVEAPLILRGIGQEKTVRISVKDVPETDIVFDVSFRGEYANFLNGPKSLVIPAGRQVADYNFEINPKDAPTGDYEAYIDFVHDFGGKVEGGTGMEISTGVTAIVRFSVVGEEVISFKIDDLSVRDSEVGLPIYPSFFVNNEGNVFWKPDSIQMTATHIDDGSIFQDFEIISEEIPQMEPGRAQSALLEVEHELPIGKYKAEADFYYRGEKVSTLQSDEFDIFAPGTLQQQGELVSAWTDKQVYQPGEVINLEALFENTGTIVVKGFLNSRIYDEQDSIIDTFRSEDAIVETGQEETFAEEFRIFEPGLYTIPVYVEYGNKQTVEKTVTISIEEAKISAIFVQWWLLLLIIIVIIVVVIIFRRRRKKFEEMPNDDGVNFVK